MKRRAVCIISLLILFCEADSRAQSAIDIVKRADEHGRGKTSVAEMSIQTIRPGWSREIRLKAWTKGNNLTLILITAPAKEKGIAFLKKGKEIWNWLPSIERNVKLPPSMMSQSWMGTDFTNDDLVKESSIVEDYNHLLIGEEKIDERMCYKIQLKPKELAAVVWGKIMLWIDKKDDIMLKAEYYDEEDVLVNTMSGSDIQMMGNRILPTKVTMIPADKPGNQTVMRYHSIQFDKPIEERFFSSQNLPRIK